MAERTKTPVIAHRSAAIASSTLRCLNTCEIGARFCVTTPFEAPAGESRIVIHMIAATINPGMPTVRKTSLQEITSRSCVARIGATARPNNASAHWYRPEFMPTRLGCEASRATATLVGATAPSAAPIRARTNNRLAKPAAIPLNADSSENTATAGTSTRLRPMRSARPPMKIDDTPHEMPSIPTRLPRS